MIRMNLKLRRIQCGLTQAQLAQKARISPVTYNRLERGHRTPNVIVAQRIARVLEVPVGDLFPVHDTITSPQDQVSDA